MNQSIISFFRSTWHKNPKYKGLQIMMIGFLGASIGAGISLLGGLIRGVSTIQFVANIVGFAFIYSGWGLIILGAITMFIGIVTHWLNIVQKYN